HPLGPQCTSEQRIAHSARRRDTPRLRARRVAPCGRYAVWLSPREAGGCRRGVKRGVPDTKNNDVLTPGARCCRFVMGDPGVIAVPADAIDERRKSHGPGTLHFDALVSI